MIICTERSLGRSLGDRISSIVVYFFQQSIGQHSIERVAHIYLLFGWARVCVCFLPSAIIFARFDVVTWQRTTFRIRNEFARIGCQCVFARRFCELWCVWIVNMNFRYVINRVARHWNWYTFGTLFPSSPSWSVWKSLFTYFASFIYTPRAMCRPTCVRMCAFVGCERVCVCVCASRCRPCGTTKIQNLAPLIRSRSQIIIVRYQNYIIDTTGVAQHFDARRNVQLLLPHASSSFASSSSASSLRLIHLNVYSFSIIYPKR